MKGKNLAIIDMDAMVYNIAYNQVKAGNRTDPTRVANHVARFVATVETSSKCESSIRIFQGEGHRNFRKALLPEYKGHRKTPEFISIWKETICETFKDMISLPVYFIESDDAVNIIAREHGLKNVLIVSSDKDLKQIPAAHYDPFKTRIKAEQRWCTVSHETAERFFWAQVLAGDATDMPNELCGITGVGVPTGLKKLKPGSNYMDIVQQMYTKAYGSEGFKRANLTYKMVKLLKDGKELYLPEEAAREAVEIKNNYKKKVVPLKNELKALFEKPVDTSDINKLFNK